MKKIQTQTELSPRALVLACAEGLLGELIKNARMGFSDMATELPLHPTVQQIAASRGYHHHHEYPVIATQGKGDHKRLDFVFTRLTSQPRRDDGSNNYTLGIALEMKVFGRRSRNFVDSWPEGGEPKLSKCKSVTKDMAKIHHFLSQTVPSLNIPKAVGYLMVVNMDADAGIKWDVQKSGGIRKQDVSLIQRYIYSRGLIHKSVTVYEVNAPR